MIAIFLGGCKLQVSHGGKTAKTFGTTNLSVHLKDEQPELYTEFEKKVSKALREAKEVLENQQNHVHLVINFL